VPFNHRKLYNMAQRVPCLWNKRIIEEGDVAFLWRGNKEMPQRLVVKKGEEFHNDFGVFVHDDLIGKAYGTRIYSKKPKTKTKGSRKRTRNTTDYMYIMSFSPEIWTDSLSHRTQILYTTDNSVITGNLHLKPGCRVAESGTGSGSLSHVLARAIGPSGHLDTFEFNLARAEEAKQDFERHGLSTTVTVHHRDVCSEGFGTEKENTFDAIFLDLPTPWLAVASAKACLRSSGRICSFSPCIEQVQAFCNELQEYGFYEIETYECLLKEYMGNLVNYPTPCCITGNRKVKHGSNEGTDKSSSNDMKEQEQETEKDQTDENSQAKKIALTGKESIQVRATRPLANIAGHTGFLTFAYRQ